MDRERWQRLTRVVHEAARCSEEDQRAFVESACPDDPSLAAEALAILRGERTSAEPADSALEPPLVVVMRAGSVVGPYRLVAEVGRGGMGVVWEARSVATDERVALKVFHPHLAAHPGALQRFRREARIGRAVDHENVVRALEFGTTDIEGTTVPFLAMEFVEGRTLRRLLADLGTVPEGLLREIAAQVAAGLEAIHARDVVHRDVKPDNVLITAEKRVRLLDLGVAKIRDVATQLTRAGHFIGSLQYAAPEQCDASSVGPAADLYSLGVVLYELAVGTNPFAGHDLMDALRRHLHLVPPRVDERCSQLSPFLAQVIATLLEKRPERRFASAAELRTVLAEGERGNWWREQSTRSPAASRPRLPVGREAGLYGRDRELERLSMCWSDARAGTGRVVLVEGEPGAGKTRLLDAWLDTVSTRDADVLYTSYSPVRGRGGIRDTMLRRFGPQGLHDAVAPFLEDAAALLPGFVAMVHDELPPEGTAPLSRAALASVLIRILRGLAALQPVVWIVDDVHLADTSSRALLLALARTVPGTRTLFVLAARTGAETATRADELFSRLPDAERLELGPIDKDALGRLVADVVGPGTLARRLTRVVSERSGGVPLFALQILRDLRERGCIAPTAGGAWIEARRIDSIEIPAALREAVRARFESLGREERSVLDVAALLGPSFDPELIARVRGASRIAVLEILSHLERRHGIVRSEGARFRFDHNVLPEVLATDLAPALAAELHAAVADALAERAGVTPASATKAPPETAARILRHALDGVRPEVWLDLISPALAHLNATLAHQEAVELCDRALALPRFDAGGPRSALLTVQARHLVALGNAERCGRALAEAVRLAEEAGDERRLLQALESQSHASLSSGNYEAAIAATDRADAIAEHLGDARARFEIASVRGQIHWCRGEFEEGRRWHARSAEIARANGDVLLEGRACSNAAAIEHEVGHLDRAERLLRRALELLATRPERASLLPPTTNLGNVLHDLGRNAEALRKYEETLELCGEFAYGEAEAVAWVNIADVRLLLGDRERARTACAQSLAICRALDSPRIESYAHAVLGVADAWDGDFDAAHGRFAQARTIRHDLGNRPGELEMIALLGWVAKERGDIAGACRLLDEAFAEASAIDDVNTAVRAAAWRMGLPGGGPESVLDLLGRHERRIRHDIRMEVRYLLWEHCRDAAHLAEARHLLAVTRAHAPTDGPPVETPLHRAIDAAAARG